MQWNRSQWRPSLFGALPTPALLFYSALFCPLYLSDPLRPAIDVVDVVVVFVRGLLPATTTSAAVVGR